MLHYKEALRNVLQRQIAALEIHLKYVPEDVRARIRKPWMQSARPGKGFKDAVWARRDPDLSLLRGGPEFERLYPEPSPSLAGR